MYGHTPNNDPYSFSPDSLTMSGSVTSLLQPHTTFGYLTPPSVLVIPTYELDSVCATSSGGYDSPGYNAGMVIQRTESSHSIATQFHNNEFFNQPISSPTELLDFDGNNSTSMRRVFSAEDLQGTHMVQCHSHRSESPISSESNSIIESMNKACRYSPDEKKERIERYRSKKTQRNFTKKIKYVCRKTLADSRPRIRGRFAKNDEIEKTMEHQCTIDQGDAQERFDEEYDGIWMTNIIDSVPPNLFP